MFVSKLKSVLAVGILGTLSGPLLAAGPAATIEDLAWITGNYAGALGPNQLEENWIKAEGGSIAAMVRMTGNDATSMFEVITVEESEGSLVLNIQQFNPGFVPRTPTPQKMELAAITENHVQFTAVTDGGFKSLGYTRSGDSFTIHLENPDGSKRDLSLSVRSIWD